MARILGFNSFGFKLNESKNPFGSKEDPFLIHLSTDGLIGGRKGESMGDLYFYGPKVPFVKTTENAKKRDDLIGDLRSLGIGDVKRYEIDRAELKLGYHFNARVKDYGITDIEFVPDFADLKIMVDILDSEWDMIEEREIEIPSIQIPKKNFRVSVYEFNLPLFVTGVDITSNETNDPDVNWLDPEKWRWDFKIGYDPKDR